MKNWNLIALMAFLLTFSGCEVVGDILEVGIWMGIIIVVVIVLIVVWILKKLF